MREPERKRGEEVGCGGVEGSNGALGDGVDAEAVGEGDFLEFGDDIGDALRELFGEAAEVAQDGGRPVVKKKARTRVTAMIRRKMATAREGW